MMSEAVKVARIQAKQEDKRMARDIAVAALASPLASTFLAWTVNQVFYKSGFYDDSIDPSVAKKTVTSTAEWIGAFGVVEAAVVASKSINLPDLALKGISALALVK